MPQNPVHIAKADERFLCAAGAFFFVFFGNLSVGVERLLEFTAQKQEHISQPQLRLRPPPDTTRRLQNPPQVTLRLIR